MDYYWTTDDLHAGRCSLAQLGQLRPTVEVLEAITLDNSPEAMVRVGISTLLRIAQQQRDIPSALKAAALLLDRALGKVVAPVLPPAPPPTLPDGSQDWPEWLTAQRHGYKLPQEGQSQPNGDALGAAQAPSSTQTSHPPEKTLPAEPVQPPQFWDGPSKPAN